MLPDGKRIVLTGGLGGIGAALSKRLRESGASLRVIDRQSGEGVIQADLSDSHELDRVCRRLQSEPVDILINLAGLIFFGHLPDEPPDHLAAMLRVNLEAPIRLCQAIIPGMVERGQGQIVNVGSVFGSVCFPHFAAYSATKAGLRGFSEALRREYRNRGISVTYVAPRAVKTSLNSGLIPELHRRTGVVNDSVEKVADRIFSAMRNDDDVTIIGFPEGLVARINALFPAAIDHALKKRRDIANDLLDSKEEKPYAKAV